MITSTIQTLSLEGIDNGIGAGKNGKSCRLGRRFTLGIYVCFPWNANMEYHQWHQFSIPYHRGTGNEQSPRRPTRSDDLLWIFDSIRDSPYRQNSLRGVEFWQL